MARKQTLIRLALRDVALGLGAGERVCRCMVRSLKFNGPVCTISALVDVDEGTIAVGTRLPLGRSILLMLVAMSIPSAVI
jgi:hypothetical protein